MVLVRLRLISRISRQLLSPLTIFNSIEKTWPLFNEPINIPDNQRWNTCHTAASSTCEQLGRIPPESVQRWLAKQPNFPTEADFLGIILEICFSRSAPLSDKLFGTVVLWPLLGRYWAWAESHILKWFMDGLAFLRWFYTSYEMLSRYPKHEWTLIGNIFHLQK